MMGVRRFTTPGKQFPERSACCELVGKRRVLCLFCTTTKVTCTTPHGWVSPVSLAEQEQELSVLCVPLRSP